MSGGDQVLHETVEVGSRLSGAAARVVRGRKGAEAVGVRSEFMIDGGERRMRCDVCGRAE